MFAKAGGLHPVYAERKDPAVLGAAAWAASSTPASDALFVLPPDASAFSLHARRGQIVSFKLVPQLSGELAEWDRRMSDVLDVEDPSVFAGGFAGYRLSQEAMRRRYDELPAEHLFEVARRYGARYVFRSAQDDGVEAAIAWRGADGAVLYDLVAQNTPSAAAAREAATTEETQEGAE